MGNLVLSNSEENLKGFPVTSPPLRKGGSFEWPPLATGKPLSSPTAHLVISSSLELPSVPHRSRLPVVSQDHRLLAGHQTLCLPPSGSSFESPLFGPVWSHLPATYLVGQETPSTSPSGAHSTQGTKMGCGFLLPSVFDPKQSSLLGLTLLSTLRSVEHTKP